MCACTCVLGGSVCGVLHRPITRIRVTGVDVESLTGSTQKAEEMCQFGSCHPVRHFGSSFDDGWTSAGDKRNIPVCRTLNSMNTNEIYLTLFGTATGVMPRTVLQSSQTREKSSGEVKMSPVVFPLVLLFFMNFKFKKINKSHPWRGWERWGWEGSCSCENNEVTADMNESHEQSLGRRLVATGEFL